MRPVIHLDAAGALPVPKPPGFGVHLAAMALVPTWVAVNTIGRPQYDDRWSGLGGRGFFAPEVAPLIRAAGADDPRLGGDRFAVEPRRPVKLVAPFPRHFAPHLARAGWDVTLYGRAL